MSRPSLLAPDFTRAAIGLLALMVTVLYGLALAGLLLPEERGAPVSIVAEDVAGLANHLGGDGYVLAEVRRGAPVPRTLLVRLPGDWTGPATSEIHKSLFIKLMLPLILTGNERIRADRARLLAITDRVESGRRLARHDRVWLSRLAAGYAVAPTDLAALGTRVDVIPPSLALAQAILESGWGTSRFARAGNALFGQWTRRTGAGIVPARREPGLRHEIMAFDRLEQSVAAYMRNLNTHPAYRSFRLRRREMRESGRPLDGDALAAGLSAYAPDGPVYVEKLRAIIGENRLRAFDRARLRAHGVT